LSWVTKRTWSSFSWRNVEEEVCFEPVLNCFILFSRNLIQLIRRRDEKLTTAVKYEFISVSQKAVKLVIYRSCVLPLIFFSKTGIQATRTVVFRLLSPVSLIPIHHVVSVSSRGWGMTLDPYAIHWLTWSTKGIVYSWCKGSLPGRKAPIGMKINTSIVSELTGHHQYRHQRMRSPIIVSYNWEDYLENIQWEIQAVLDLSVKWSPKKSFTSPSLLTQFEPSELVWFNKWISSSIALLRTWMRKAHISRYDFILKEILRSKSKVCFVTNKAV